MYIYIYACYIDYKHVILFMSMLIKHKHAILFISMLYYFKRFQKNKEQYKGLYINWYKNFSAWFRAVGKKFTKWGGVIDFFTNSALFEKCRIRQKIDDPPSILWTFFLPPGTKQKSLYTSFSRRRWLNYLYCFGFVHNLIFWKTYKII